MTNVDAALYAGISAMTLQIWIRKGEAQLAIGNIDNVYSKFCIELQRHRSVALAEALKEMRDSAIERHELRATEWLLRHHGYGKDQEKQQADIVVQSLGGNVTIGQQSLDELTDAELKDRLVTLRKLQVVGAEVEKHPEPHIATVQPLIRRDGRIVGK
jgi:hypothetical protein